MFKKLWAIWKIRKEVNNMKFSEIKTSEGRLTMALNVMTLYATVQGFLPPALTVKVAVASIAAYGIARAIVKLGEAIAKITPSTKDDAIVSEADKILDALAPK